MTFRASRSLSHPAALESFDLKGQPVPFPNQYPEVADLLGQLIPIPQLCPQQGGLHLVATDLVAQVHDGVRQSGQSLVAIVDDRFDHELIRLGFGVFENPVDRALVEIVAVADPARIGRAGRPLA